MDLQLLRLELHTIPVHRSGMDKSMITNVMFGLLGALSIKCVLFCLPLEHKTFQDYSKQLQKAIIKIFQKNIPKI